MIFIGTDIIEISRINKIIRDKGHHFLAHIFTNNEQSICNAKSSPSIHYSGKFAAKEAVKKALLSSNLKKNISLKTIEIQNELNGAPNVVIKENKDLFNIQVSISHTKDYAIAMAILQIK